MAGKKMGELLIEKGLIDNMQLESAIGRQTRWGGRLGENLVKMGFISEIEILNLLSDQLHFPCADLSKLKLKEDIFQVVPLEIARKYHIIPLQTKENIGKKLLFLAMADPTNIMAIDEIQFVTGLTVKPVIAADSQIESAIEKYYVNKTKSIEPLAEKVRIIKQEEMELVHEVPLIEKIRDERKEHNFEENEELLALVRVLVRKGIITKAEYIAELKRIREHK